MDPLNPPDCTDDACRFYKSKYEKYKAKYVSLKEACDKYMPQDVERALQPLQSDAGGYRLELISGTYQPIETILRNVRRFADAEWEKPERKIVDVRQSFINNYFSTFYVRYKFVSMKGKGDDTLPPVYCHYMQPIISDCMTGFSLKKGMPMIQTLMLTMSPSENRSVHKKSSYCEIQWPAQSATALHLEPCISSAIFHSPPSLTKFGGTIDDYLCISEIVVHPNDTGKGYMNILMCLAATFADQVLGRKYFYLDAETMSHGQTSTTDLQTKVYPSFGFEAITGHPNMMYVRIKDIAGLGKCVDPKVKVQDS